MTDPIKSPFLSDIEHERIVSFYNDAVMREAVRKVILAGVYNNGVLKPGEPADPTKNFALSLAFAKGDYSNEDLGADLRAVAEGIRAVEQGFNELSKYVAGKNEAKADEPNPGM